jgi:hypothetical protein
MAFTDRVLVHGSVQAADDVYSDRFDADGRVFFVRSKLHYRPSWRASLPVKS